MRLLFLSNIYPSPVSPGKGTFNASLIRALAEQAEVQVICPISWIDRYRHARKNLTSWNPVHSNSPVVEHPTYYYTPKILRGCYGAFLDWSIGSSVRRMIRDFQPDAIVSYWAHPDGAVALRHAHAAGLPAISMVGGSDVLLLGKSGLRRRRILDVLRNSEAVVAVSDDIVRHLERDGIPADKLHVVRRGVDRTLFSPGDQTAARKRLGLPPDVPILIAVGRLVPVKGFNVLIEACHQLQARGQDFRCYLLGSGECHASLSEQIQCLNLNQQVVLQGAQLQSQLPDWYRAADLTVLSSFSEGVPNVLMESIACGTRFVATDVGGVSEIADPDAHRLVPPRDPKAMADAIEELLAQPYVPRPRRFEPNSWQDSASELCAIISRCCEQSARNKRL
ncbi:MAG: glycosyltransferase [Planctomycetales bacterium]